MLLLALNLPIVDPSFHTVTAFSRSTSVAPILNPVSVGWYLGYSFIIYERISSSIPELLLTSTSAPALTTESMIGLILANMFLISSGVLPSSILEPYNITASSVDIISATLSPIAPLYLVIHSVPLYSPSPVLVIFCLVSNPYTKEALSAISICLASTKLTPLSAVA